MKVRYIEDTVFLWCTKDKIYDVISIEYGSYRIVDDEGEDYLHDSCGKQHLFKALTLM